MLDDNTISAGESNLKTNSVLYATEISSGNINSAGTVTAERVDVVDYVWASGNISSNYIYSTGNLDADGQINANTFVYINGKANVGWGCSPNGLQGRTSEGAILSCVNGVWKSSSARIERTQFLVSSGSNYGDICQSNIDSNGMAEQGWVASGSDACTEDGNDCSVDNVRCFAIRIVN